MHQQPRGPFQPTDPYQQQTLDAQYQQRFAPPAGAPAIPRPAPRRRPPGQRPRWLYAVALVAVAVISFALGDAVGKSHGTSTPPSAASTPRAVSAQPAAKASSATPAAAHVPAAPRPHVIARFTGSGIENTSRFVITGSGNWELKWSYNCSATGSSGNFIVSEDNGNDVNGANVNELGAGGHGATHVYGDSGTHFLSVDSECTWKMTAVTQP